MANSVWKGYITFGLISIPACLKTGPREAKSVELNTFHRGCGGRMGKPDICKTCQATVKRSDIERGYTVDEAKGTYIPIPAEEIEAIEPESNKTIEITETVKWADVDPLYLAEAFYLLPEDPGRKAYSLLVSALKQSGRVAIGQICKSNREHVVLLRPKGAGLVAHFLWYANEVKDLAEFDALELEKLTAQESKLALKLVENLEADFQPQAFENGYQMRLSQLVASKLDKTGNTKAPTPGPGKKHEAPRDLTEMLAASIKQPRKRAA